MWLNDNGGTETCSSDFFIERGAVTL
jgi:hypothetical protein